MSSLNVQFGSGGNILDGWKNHDQHDADINQPLPYKDGEVEMILCEHCLEHTNGPNALRFLDECHRILKPGGKLFLSVPVLDRLDKEHSRDIVLNHGHQVPYTCDSFRAFLGTTHFTNGRRLEMDSNLENKDAELLSIFGHWRVIGHEKDDLESCRWMLIK